MASGLASAEGQRRAIITKSTGSTMSVSRVALTSPPMTTTARGRCVSAPMLEAVHNLIDNAITYGGPGTRVTVSVQRAKALRAWVLVTDDGPGIPAADRTRVLRRFQRATPTGSTPVDQSSGTGLGLAIVAEIARAHDGQVRIDAGPGGRGTCVVIGLPQHGKAALR